MLSKYKINTLLIKYYKLLTILILINVCVNSHAQISGGGIESNEKEKNDKVKRDSMSGTTFFLTGLTQYSFRTFEDRSVYGIYEKRNDESPIYSGGIAFGLIMPFSGKISLELGLSYFGHGEQYNFQSPTNDSTFYYKRTYMQIGLPLKVRYTIGDRFQFFGYAGVTPLNILNIRYQEEYTKEDGALVTNDLELIKDGFTSFNVIASAGVGLNYNLDYIGFTLYPEYRHYLMNTYADVSIPLNHKMWGIGLNFGLLLRF